MRILFTLAITAMVHLLNAQVTYVDQSASGQNDGSSWADAYTDLGDALRNTTEGSIWIAEGTYRPGGGVLDTNATFLISAPLKLYGGFAGGETELSDRDWVNNVANINGDLNEDDNFNNFEDNRTDNSRHVFVVDSLLGEPVVFDGLNISNGHSSTGFEEFTSRGGGIYAYSTIEVYNCEFSNNYSANGAAIFIGPYTDGGDNSLFERSTFRNNMSDNRSIIYFFGLNNITARDCSFFNNTVTRGAFYFNTSDNTQVIACDFQNNAELNSGSFGGAIFDWNSTNSLIRDCTFFGNSASNGSVMYSDGRDIIEANPNDLVFANNVIINNISNESRAIATWKRSMTIDSCTFDRNQAIESTGIAGFSGDLDVDNEVVIVSNSEFTNNSSDWSAGITNWGVNLTLDNCYFSDNIAERSGTALNIGNVSNNTIRDCEFTQNTAGWGGAMYFQNDSSTAVITNSTFTLNTVENTGGAINNAGGNNVTISGCIFENNSANFGGALSSASDEEDALQPVMNISNSIIRNNESITQGAGINLINSNSTITNCEISQNMGDISSSLSGGGLSLNSSGDYNCEVSIINSTISDNFSNIGPGIGAFTDSVSTLNITLQNTIIRNLGLNYEIEAGTPSVVSNGGNICGDISLMDALVAENDLNDANPLFADELNGDYNLAPGSPAISNGVETGAPLTDINGNNRLYTIDSGAYEYLSTGFGEIDIDRSSLITLSPNPVQNQGLIQFDNHWVGDLEIVVVDMNGRILMKQISSKYNDTFNHRMDLSNLSAGQYELIVIQGQKAIAESFIKM